MTKILTTASDCVSISWQSQRRQLTIRIKSVENEYAFASDYTFTSDGGNFKQTLALLDAACTFRTVVSGLDSSAVHQEAMKLIRG